MDTGIKHFCPNVPIVLVGNKKDFVMMKQQKKN